MCPIILDIGGYLNSDTIINIRKKKTFSKRQQDGTRGSGNIIGQIIITQQIARKYT